MIGILPAAGQATRIYGIPKMLLPVPEGALIDVMVSRMQRDWLCKYLYIGTNRAAYGFLRQRERIRHWVQKAETQTMSETVLLAREYLQPSAYESVVMGMPDTYFDDADAFRKLATVLDYGADVAVGLFRARDGQRNGGMVRVNGNRVIEVIDKPESGDYEYIWGVLAWTPRFWELLDASEPHVGYALPRAIERGFDVRAVRMDGDYYDCGTVAGYFELVNHLTREAQTA